MNTLSTFIQSFGFILCVAFAYNFAKALYSLILNK